MYSFALMIKSSSSVLWRDDLTEPKWVN